MEVPVSVPPGAHAPGCFLCGPHSTAPPVCAPLDKIMFEAASGRLREAHDRGMRGAGVEVDGEVNLEGRPGRSIPWKSHGRHQEAGGNGWKHQGR